MQQENKDAADRKLELSNMNKWKSEKEAAESQMNRLRSENQRLASFEGRYNLLLKSEFYWVVHTQVILFCKSISEKVGSDP